MSGGKRRARREKQRKRIPRVRTELEESGTSIASTFKGCFRQGQGKRNAEGKMRKRPTSSNTIIQKLNEARVKRGQERGKRAG